MTNQPEFDGYVQDYDESYNDSIQKLSGFGREYFAQYKIDIVKEKTKNLPKKILDFGCGDGLTCELLKKAFPQSEIVGVDVSEESIKIAKDKNCGCEFILYDGQNLPFEEKEFDLIFSSCVFHHIETQNHLYLLEELCRVSNSGAKLFIFEHNPINPLTRKIFRDCIFDKGANMIGAKNLQDLIKKANFQDAKINYTLFSPRYKLFEKFFALEKYLTGCCLGAQYYIEASKIIMV